MTPDPVEDLLRHHAPQVLGALVRRYGHFDTAEDAVQEALLAAARQWPGQGIPDNPRGWLIRVASRRLTDALRSETARRVREEAQARLLPRDTYTAPAPDAPRAPAGDDTLTLLYLCCHPDLGPASQVALTLRAVGGLTTAEIARAYLVPEATVAQRISRAKRQLRGAEFRRPDRWRERLPALLQVLYLIFNEGYTATSGTELRRADLAVEAIRLARAVHALLPADSEVTGLLALMLLTDARRAARTDTAGELVRLDEQDRTLWDREAIAEGIALVERALPHGPVGAYQLQAAIAALHDEAGCAEDTDWPQILALYDLLVRAAPAGEPMAALGRAVAVAMVHGPAAGLAETDRLTGVLGGHHRLAAVRAHLLELAGDRGAARAAYQEAAAGTLSQPEQRYLRLRAARLTPGGTGLID
ncbi:sigma-70 family RNA polymerase sigma factor [Streptomyces sp. NPDC050264]|uniref:RNA polymerase sigma factor n=1 Tax=Streptomyces sp. NPDC050264 TaxID=3155038 RepID=UPI003431EF57